MAIYLSNRDGGKTDEQGHYKFQTNAFTGNVLDGGLLVTQNSPLAMNVKVSGGDARIPYSDYAYTAWIPAGAPETVTVTTANPSNPRIDRLVMYVDRGATPSSATANNPTLCKLMLVAGTPAGSPSRPSNGTVNTAVSNNPYIDLADIRVNAGVTQITDANITDTRVQAVPRELAGVIKDYAGLEAPEGYLLCYGQAISRTTYSRLFSAIGTTYGVGDGSTTFNIPDARGRVIAGKDNMGGSSANRLTNQSGGLNGDTLGAVGGAETHTLATTEIPAHSHPVGYGGAVAVNYGSQVGVRVDGANNTSNTGGGGAHNNVQPTLILNKIIAY